jgi:hypothetical protein
LYVAALPLQIRAITAGPLGEKTMGLSDKNFSVKMESQNFVDPAHPSGGFSRLRLSRILRDVHRVASSFCHNSSFARSFWKNSRFSTDTAVERPFTGKFNWNSIPSGPPRASMVPPW